MSQLLIINFLTTLTIINLLASLCTPALSRADAADTNTDKLDEAVNTAFERAVANMNADTLAEAGNKAAERAIADKQSKTTVLSIEETDNQLVTFLCGKVEDDLSDLCKIWLGTQKAVDIVSQPSAVIAAITFFQTKCVDGSKAATNHQKDPEMSPETNRVLSSAVPLFNEMGQRAAAAIDSIKTNNFASAKKTLMDATAEYEPVKGQLSTVLDKDKMSYKSMLVLVHYTGVSLDIAYQLVCIVESLEKPEEKIPK